MKRKNNNSTSARAKVWLIAALAVLVSVIVAAVGVLMKASSKAPPVPATEFPSSIATSRNGALRLIWRVRASWILLRTPAVANGKVFLMTKPGELSAFDLRDGSNVWNIDPPERGSYESPVIDAGVLYLACGNSNMAAVDLDTGKVLWSTYVVPKDYGTRSGAAHAKYTITSPAVGGGLIYFGSQDDKVYALNRATGKQVWMYPVGADIAASPVLAGDVLYVGSYAPWLCALDAQTGQLLWQCGLTEGVEWAAPVTDGTTVYVASPSGHVHAVDTTTKAIRWVRKVGERFRAGMALSDKLLCVADSSGIYGLDPATGDVLWRVPHSAANPVIEGDIVFCVAHGAGLLLIDGSTGEVLDEYAKESGSWRSRPVVTGKHILLTSGPYIYCLEFNTDRLVTPEPNPQE